MAKFDNGMIFRIVLIVLAAFVLFALINYYTSKQNNAKIERFYEEALQKAGKQPTDGTPEKPFDSPLIVRDDQDAAVSGAGKPQPSEEESNESYRTVDFSTQKLPSDCFPKDRLSAEDLLPKDAANLKWSAASPAGQGSLSDVNLLSAGHHIGINTVGSTLRNANLQLRSEVPNPRLVVSPWSQSTIEPDVLRASRPMEIGGEC
jgi:hypothetical protein